MCDLFGCWILLAEQFLATDPKFKHSFVKNLLNDKNLKKNDLIEFNYICRCRTVDTPSIRSVVCREILLLNCIMSCGALLTIDDGVWICC